MLEKYTQAYEPKKQHGLSIGRLNWASSNYKNLAAIDRGYYIHHTASLLQINHLFNEDEITMKIDELSAANQQALEAAAFRRLLEHLDSRKDVQNIDLMNLAGFCRNCLSKWYVAAAQAENIELDYEEARTRIYGMPYTEWKEKYQQDASAAQLQQFQQSTQQEQ